MYPGGYDHVLDGPVSRNDRDLLFRMVRAQWPDALWEDCLSNAPSQLVCDLWKGPGPAWQSKEFFLRKARGLRAFLHVLVRTDDLTLVASRRQRGLVREMLQAIQINRMSWGMAPPVVATPPP